MLSIFIFGSSCVEAKENEIKLVLQITVDQLRGDLPLRFKKRFVSGGFKRFLEKGAYYSNAHYAHADTETAPGHATLSTGGMPAQHGITNSEWWDYDQGKVVYAVEDADFPIIGKNAISTAGTSTTEKGRAPTNLLSTTIADEILLASEDRGKALAISGKDRAAILPAGKTGLALWLSRGEFTNSTYYNKDVPKWVKDWNAKKPADNYRGKSWELLLDRDSYWRKDKDNRPYEGYYHHLGGTMPKSYDNKDDDLFYNGLIRTPAGDELLLDFAKYAIDNQKLGQRDTTDYLSVSFSSTDYVGHTWGIGSLEQEDNILRVDRNLADLFDYVDKKIGRNHVLIALSADHGVAEIAEAMVAKRISSGRIPTKKFTEYINKGLSKKFETDKKLVLRFIYPYIYLNLKNIEEIDKDVEDVEEEAVKLTMKYPGITYAVSRSDILEGELVSNSYHYAQIINSFHPKRSGHVHVITNQFFMFGKHKTNQPGEHGSVWSYDTYVPVAFSGPGVKKGLYKQRVGPQDIAPTIAAYIGVKPPSGSVGDVLLEVCENNP